MTHQNLWLMLAHIHGSVLNMEMLSKSLELTGPTIKKVHSFSVRSIPGSNSIAIPYEYQEANS